MDVNRDEYFQECFRVDHECWLTGASSCDDHEKLKNNSNIAMTRDRHSKHWATRPSQGHTTITRRRGESRGNDRANQIHTCSSLYHTADNSGCVILTRLRPAFSVNSYFNVYEENISQSTH